MAPSCPLSVWPDCQWFVWELIPSPITLLFYLPPPPPSFELLLCCAHKVCSLHWPGSLSHTHLGMCTCVYVHAHVLHTERSDFEDQIHTIKNAMKCFWLVNPCVDAAQCNCVCALSSWLVALSQISHPTQWMILNECKNTVHTLHLFSFFCLAHFALFFFVSHEDPSTTTQSN